MDPRRPSTGQNAAIQSIRAQWKSVFLQWKIPWYLRPWLLSGPFGPCSRIYSRCERWSDNPRPFNSSDPSDSPDSTDSTDSTDSSTSIFQLEQNVLVAVSW